MNPRFSIYLLIIFGLVLSFISGCKKDDNKGNNLVYCHDIVNGHPGYEVWAGDSALFMDPTLAYVHLYYNIDKLGYTRIGDTTFTTTHTFNTGSYKYYVIVAKYYSCIDAIRFADGSYYDQGQGYGLIGGLADYYNPNGGFLGAPDDTLGKLGYKDLCPPPVPAGIISSFPDGTSSTFNGYITDTQTILSRGGGLTVVVGSGCQ